MAASGGDSGAGGDKKLVVAVMGATGGCGKALMLEALKRGHSVRVLARTPSKLGDDAQGEGLAVIEGDATQAADVAQLCSGADAVVSCIGNSDGGDVRIMAKVAANVLAAVDAPSDAGGASSPSSSSSASSSPAKVLFVTSLGMGGSSWPVKVLLQFMIGRSNVADYDAADGALMAAAKKNEAEGGSGGGGGARITVVRPTALVDSPSAAPAGKYLATSAGGMAARPVHKSDVGLFLADCLTDDTWDDKAVHLYPAA